MIEHQFSAALINAVNCAAFSSLLNIYQTPKAYHKIP